MQLTENKSVQAICQVYAAVSYICIADAESSSRVIYFVLVLEMMSYIHVSLILFSCRPLI